MGCVAYAPTVGEIWSGIQDYLVHDCGVPFEYVLFDSYEDQVKALVNSRSIDIAWNGPVAHVLAEQATMTVNDGNNKNGPNNNKVQLVSLGMRDVDQDFESILVARKNSPFATALSVDDFCANTQQHACHLLTGSRDSPQAHLVPYYYLTKELNLTFSQTTPFDVDLGKHGDTAVGEIQAMETLSKPNGIGDVAIVSRMMWDRAVNGKLSSIDPVQLQETCQEVTAVPLPRLDHCQFDAILTSDESPTNRHQSARLNDFGQALLAMQWENPKHQRLMELEGIRKEWKPPRQEGYQIVRQAVLGGSTSALARHQAATNFQYQIRRSYSSSAATSAGKRVAVIGAGVAGLQTIRALKGHGFDVTAFEASPKVGGLWKANYANFGVQVPKQLYEFQDYPMTELKWGEYASGPQVQDYIERYAQDFGLTDAIQYNTAVTSATPISNGEKGVGWKVATRSSSSSALEGRTEENVQEFDYLVVATGLFASSKKFIPSKPGQETFQGSIVHSSEFQNASVAQGKNVVVLGGGKSAVDCAIQASKAGASSVTILQRTAHWPTPQKIAGVIPFQYIFLSRFGTSLVSIHKGTFPGSGPVVNAFRNTLGSYLTRPIFRIVEELFAFQFGLKGELRPQGDVVTDFYKVAMVLDSTLKQMRESGQIQVKVGEMDHYGSDGKSIHLHDGSVLPTDLVIAATGFAQDYSVFSDPTTRSALDMEKDGLYLYNYILPPKLPHLAFIGHVSAISNISTYGLQAEWLARHWTGALAVAKQDTITEASAMQREIEARKTWARSFMPASSSRGMQVLLHHTHYHDRLLKEMGINAHRKSNPLSEYLMPYEPADYDGIMADTRKQQ